MNLKILYLILFILMFMPIGLCEIIKDDINLNNTKVYDKNDKIVSIYDKNNEKSIDIKLISTISDIDKLIKIVEITNYIEYIPDKNNFITKTKKVYGKNDVYKIEYFIEKYNYTFENIIINETNFNNKTGKNETKIINKSIIKDINPFWVEFKPYNKIMFKNETFKLKIIHYKNPELGFFKIQTIPIFKNIECKEFTWWSGNWNLKRPILINNTNGDNVTNYQLKSVNLSQYQINASSARIINESSGLIENHWNELIDDNGNLEYVWCNFSKIINNTWINNTYYIYYQNEPNVNSVSNGNLTFRKYYNFENTLNGYNSGSTSTIKSFDGNYSYLPPIGSYGQRTTDVYIRPYIWEISYFIPIGEIGAIFDMGYGFAENKDQALNLGLPIALNWGYRDSTMWYNSGVQPSHNIWHTLKIIIKTDDTYDVYSDNNIIITNMYSNLNIGQIIRLYRYTDKTIYFDSERLRKYTNNNPELWTVGNIEYPEGINMTCNIKIITHLTEKNINFVNMTGDIVNTSKTNECINLSYDSYIVYMSNPVKLSSFTELLNILDNFLVQFLLFIFLIIIATLFYVFIQVVKKKGFKL